MAKKYSRRISRRERFYGALAWILLAAAILLAIAIALQSKLERSSQRAALGAAGEGQTTAAPLVLSLDGAPTPTPEPVETPQPTQQPTPTPEPASFDFLPVYTSVKTDDRIIAVTLDDCSNLKHLRIAIDAAEQMNAKLTLLPVGKSTSLMGMAEILRKCVFELGYQVENRTWSNGAIYRMSEQDMAAEIWTGATAIQSALGKNYGMRLIRMHGGSGSTDVRTQTYLKQLGYEGILNWSVVGANYSDEDLKKTLAPGQIYLFGIDETDVKKMLRFMYYATQQGYHCVTVNELLGRADNEVSELDEQLLSQPVPALEGYESIPVAQRQGDRAYRVYEIQLRLEQLGYLSQGSADGIFGSATGTALSMFQINAGMLGSGVADLETQQRLFADDAPPAQ